MKRLSLYIVLLLVMTTIGVYADDLYPLEQNETVVDTTEISDDKVEVYTAVYGEYYKKTFEKEDKEWVIKDNQKIIMYPTGLKMDDDIEKDEPFIKALEEKLGSMLYGLEQLPSQLDLSDLGYLPVARLQHGPSCVGWATGYYLRTFQQAKDLGWVVGDNEQHIFSPNFIYNQINNGVDQGARLSDAGYLLKEVGAATLYDFPCDSEDYRKQPSYEVKQKAAPHKIREWHYLFYPSNMNKVGLTKEYLNTGDLPVVAIKVGVKWMHPSMINGTSIVTTENEPLDKLEGHAVAVVGYDDTLLTPEGYGAFKIINSYGKNWGNDGYTYMTYQAFEKVAQLGYVFTDLVNEEVVDEETISVPVKINDSVDFQMQFRGSGRYDLFIKDEQGNVVKEYLNQQGAEGQSVLSWDGTDKNNNAAKNGNYKLVITPYKGELPQEPTILNFAKKSKADAAATNAKVHKTNGTRERLEINIKAVEAGEVSVDAISGDGKKTHVKSDTIKAGEMKTYTFDHTQVNLSDNSTKGTVLLVGN